MSREFLGRTFFAATLAAIFVASPLAVAQDKTDGGWNIGVVDRSKVFESYAKQTKMMGDLETDAKKKEAELQADIDRFDAYVKEKKALEDAGKLSNEDILDIQEEFNRKENELKSKRAEWQRELDIKTQRVMSELRIDISKAIKIVGERENFHLLLEADTDARARSAVVFFSPTIDVTAKVISELNKSAGDDD